MKRKSFYTYDDNCKAISQLFQFASNTNTIQPNCFIHNSCTIPLLPRMGQFVERKKNMYQLAILQNIHLYFTMTPVRLDTEIIFEI